MRSFSCAAVGMALLFATTKARAQVAAEGYIVERFNPAAAGNPWLVMDDINLQGPLGGAVSLSTSYARRPLRVSLPDGSQSLNVVSDQALADVGLAILYERFRWTLDIVNPIYGAGQSGSLGGYQFTAPSVTIGKYPDKVVDIRFGFDARLLGDVSGPLRLGLSAQLFAPSGERATYVTDNTYRSLLRAQFAGHWGFVNFAGFAGVHIRPRDDSSKLDSASLGGPRGSEFVFGVAAAPGFALRSDKALCLGVGPEIFGESSFKGFLGKYTTALEGLLSGHLTHVDEHGARLRLKLGAGRGLNAQFGAPTWRMVLGIEISDRVGQE
jgi:hypothetical protein